ncbi:hypothetical protein N8I74_10810 [Chitiniphilus purpureus]|uniref:Uncharacterized protein n=1 Tax=Chitiniphilus purpureus TaxID=2981137 RepID=A0ABY6DHL4_9NEIS|nr:hypothetical protein [Chitiniphilus sp. CD1]UXY13812.1 hypothetical protein N8I74_10810 [Chitiniphilus sp. CD1]
MLKIQVDQQNSRVEALKVEISKAESGREERKLDLDMMLKVFSELTDIYKTQDQSDEMLVNRLTAVSALVLAIPNQPVRDRLWDAIAVALEVQGKRSGAQVAQQACVIKESVDAALFDVESAENAPAAAVSNQQLQVWASKGNASSPRWGSLNYNLFWCEDAANPNAALAAATQAKALKTLDPEAKGEWRVRKLPKGVNSRSGYQIHRNLIRASSKEEAAIGGIFATALSEYGSPGFVVEEVAYASPASISVFFCG